MPKVLFLVHVEEYFRDCFPMWPEDDAQGEGWLKRMAERCRSYDKVVALLTGYEGELVELAGVGYERWPWEFGYTISTTHDECTCEHPQDGGHERDCDKRKYLLRTDGGWTWVHPYIRDPKWRDWEIEIAGGCEYECLRDWGTVLHSLGLRYEVLDEFVYD